MAACAPRVDVVAFELDDFKCLAYHPMPFTVEQFGLLLRRIEARDRTSLYEAVHESMDTVGASMVTRAQ